MVGSLRLNHVEIYFNLGFSLSVCRQREAVMVSIGRVQIRKLPCRIQQRIFVFDGVQIKEDDFRKKVGRN